LQGRVDNVGVFLNRVLTLDEFKREQNRPSFPARRYDLLCDLGAGGIQRDQSGYGRHGAVTGATLAPGRSPRVIVRDRRTRVYAPVTIEAALAASGVGAMAATSQATKQAALSAAGAATMAAVGQSFNHAVLNAAGIGAMSAVGNATKQAVFSAAGSASVSFVSFGGSAFGGTVWGCTDSNGYLIIKDLGAATASRAVPFGLSLTGDADSYLRVKTEGSPSSPGPLTAVGNLLVAMGVAETGAPASVTARTPLGNLNVRKGADDILLVRVVGVLSGLAGPRQHIKDLPCVADENGYLCVVTES
jgi:hypothetical protein